MIENTRKYWVLGDTHFGHNKMIELGRPQGFEQIILKNCIDLIDWDDIVIHMGDVALGRNQAKILNSWLRPIPGRKILIKGNHCNESDNWYLDHGFSFVCEQFIIKRCGKKVLFTHEPSKTKVGNVNIHGHSHGHAERDYYGKDFYDTKYHKEIALELTDYKPILLDSILLNKK